MEDCDIDACTKCIEAKLPKQMNPTSSTLTIPKVPERLRLGDDDAYEPRIISFGPYHRGKSRLQAMEKHKWHYVKAILNRNRDISLGRYVSTIKEMGNRAKSCYSDYVEMDSNDFVEMMLIDGCFIVEYLLRVHERLPRELGSMIWVSPLMQYDMLLLENQLPFFVVNSIFDLVITPYLHMENVGSYPSSFAVLAINYLNKVSDKNMDLPTPPTSSIHHLLHLFHTFCLYRPNQESRTIPIVDKVVDATPKTSEELPIMIPGATVLQEAGVKFMSSKEKTSNLDVTFNNGKMVIAPLVIDSFTKSKFRNLIAFEQFYPNFTGENAISFSAYVEFMDYIVNTTEDVALLYRKGIIRHFLGSDKDVADLFNHLNRGTFVNSNHYFLHLYKEVDKYRKARRHKWRAGLMHNYFSSPWAILSIVAAGTLLLLSFLQTYFSAYSTYN